MRYWLDVPRTRWRVAIQSGCHYSKAHHLWYVDTPFWYGLNLSDFKQWKPTLYTDIALRQKAQVEEAKEKRRRKKRRFPSKSGVKFVAIRN